MSLSDAVSGMLADRLHVVEEPCCVPVLVPEDNLSRWRALRQCLTARTDLLVVRCPSPSTDVLKHCSRLMPCLLAIDLSLLDQLDPDRFRRTVDYGRAVSVLVRVQHEDPDTLDRLLRLGCMGFVTERASATVVGQAIRALAKGEIWVNQRFLGEFLRSLLSAQSPRNLTSREAEILRLISSGHSNREIAQELFISRETVRWHIRTLYAKIGVRDRAAAANHAAGLEPESQLLLGFAGPR